MTTPSRPNTAGPEIGSTMGNIYVRLEPQSAGTPLFFCAHLDTVPPEGRIEPVVGDDEVRAARLAVSAALREHRARRRHADERDRVERL